MAGGQQDEARQPEDQPRPERHQSEDDGERREQQRLGHARDRIADADQRPFGDRDQHGAVDRGAHRHDHPRQELAPEATEHPHRERPRGHGDEHAAREERDQHQQRDQEERGFARHLAADRSRPAEDGGGAERAEQRVRRLRAADMLLPISGRAGADQWQLRQPRRCRDAGLLGMFQPVHRALALLGERDRRERQRQDDEERRGEREA